VARPVNTYPLSTVGSDPPPPPTHRKGTGVVRQYRTLVERAAAHPPTPATDTDVVAEHRNEEIRRLLLDGQLNRECEWQGTDQVAYLQFKLGQAHERGWWGMEKDMEAARQSYERALNSGYSRAGYALGDMLEEKYHDNAGAVGAYERATRPCDCWTDGDCVRDAVHPHDPNDHMPAWEASLALAGGYEYGDIGAYSRPWRVHLQFASATHLSRLTTPTSTHRSSN